MSETGADCPCLSTQLENPAMDSDHSDCSSSETYKSTPATSLATSPAADATARYLCLTNAQVLEGDASIGHRPLYIDQLSGRFTDSVPPEATVQVVDMQNRLVSPGLIDVQVNGALGVDFSIFDPSPTGLTQYEQGIHEVARAMLKHGVTR